MVSFEHVLNTLLKLWPKARQEDLEDAVQDAFLKVLRHPWDPSKGMNEFSYTTLVARCCYCDIRRKKANRERLFPDIPGSAASWDGGIGEVEAKVYFEQLTEADTAQAVEVLKRIVEGFFVKEAAESVGVSRSHATKMIRIFREGVA